MSFIMTIIAKVSMTMTNNAFRNVFFLTGMCLQCLYTSVLRSNSTHTTRSGEKICNCPACVHFPDAVICILYLI